MAADLANLKQAVTMVSKLLSMGMKDTIEAVSLELYDNFPRELDFRIEVRSILILRTTADEGKAPIPLRSYIH